jgi:16S rRNA C1402 (ribose-2'-O) methylase RsmI
VILKLVPAFVLRVNRRRDLIKKTSAYQNWIDKNTAEKKLKHLTELKSLTESGRFTTARELTKTGNSMVPARDSNSVESRQPTLLYCIVLYWVVRKLLLN